MVHAHTAKCFLCVFPLTLPNDPIKEGFYCSFFQMRKLRLYRGQVLSFLSFSKSVYIPQHHRTALQKLPLLLQRACPRKTLTACSFCMPSYSLHMQCRTLLWKTQYYFFPCVSVSCNSQPKVHQRAGTCHTSELSSYLGCF